MEPLVIDWAKEEAKMARIVFNIMFIANKSIFKVDYKIFLGRSIALKECYLMINFEKNSFHSF